MEPIRVILFARQEYLAQALNAYFRAVTEQPMQQVGEVYAIEVEVNGIDFKVVRNEDSYTVEEV